MGVATALLAFSLPLIWLFLRLEKDDTRARFEAMDPSRSEVDLIVVGAAVAAIVGVAVMLVQGNSASNAAVGVATVVAAWLAVHTTYTLRYAKQYFNSQPGCLDFAGVTDNQPRMSDFAYHAFTVGMTYQVSDVTVATPEARRLTWEHAMVSFLFGTVIIASTINVVVSLASGG